MLKFIISHQDKTQLILIVIEKLIQKHSFGEHY